MERTSETDFILVGAAAEGGTVYFRQPREDRRVWLAYDVRPHGELVNGRFVSAVETDTNWRGLPVLA